ncbi:MAG: zinc chelation protein SecC [Chitinophagaceae bacterium]|nr:zinc chelation protein SecC [Chitinophagaceae bacterium]
MGEKLANSELLLHCTVRLECNLANGGISKGTGFLFAYVKKETTVEKLVIITNKHVVKNSTSLSVTFTKVASDGTIIYGSTFTEILSVKESEWVIHPEPDVDLCALPFIDIANDLIAKYGEFFLFPLDKTHLPSKEDIDKLRTMENIIMIGYPIGLWDSTNNVPLVRRGITATNPVLDYEGKKEFRIDAACFPGSSGSPVCVFDDGIFSDKYGSVYLKSRFFLLGVLYAGPVYTVTGQLILQPIPTNPISTATEIPINIGCVIKSEKLLDFENLLQ